MPVPVRFEGSVFSHALRRRGLPSGVVASFGQPFQPAVPVIPPAGRTLVPVPLHSEFHAPNNALQRTEAGLQAFLRSHVLRGQPPSLSLGALGGATLTGKQTMSDHPLYFKYSGPSDGIIAAALLVFFPAGGQLFGWLGSWFGDYRATGALFGCIALYALSVGFSLSALRQPYRSSRVSGGVVLFAAAVVFFLVFLPASPF